LGYVPRERVKVVINRYHRNSDISLKDAEEAIEERIFWTIPNDYKTTMSAINHGKPLPQIALRASVTKSIVGLADALIPKGQEPEKRRWKILKR
jgi:pilus assembly protein CpaE